MWNCKNRTLSQPETRNEIKTIYLDLIADFCKISQGAFGSFLENTSRMVAGKSGKSFQI